jgi:hypothetical protein
MHQMTIRILGALRSRWPGLPPLAAWTGAESEPAVTDKRPGERPRGSFLREVVDGAGAQVDDYI